MKNIWIFNTGSGNPAVRLLPLKMRKSKYMSNVLYITVFKEKLSDYLTYEALQLKCLIRHPS